MLTKSFSPICLRPKSSPCSAVLYPSQNQDLQVYLIDAFEGLYSTPGPESVLRQRCLHSDMRNAIYQPHRQPNIGILAMAHKVLQDN